jgi:hypothetical protein
VEAVGGVGCTVRGQWKVSNSKGGEHRLTIGVRRFFLNESRNKPPATVEW